LLQPVGTPAESCITWNDMQIGLIDLPTPAQPTTIARNSFGSEFTTDDFAGKVISAQAAPAKRPWDLLLLKTLRLA